MNKILIIRSVSLQQLDAMLPVVKSKFSNCEIYILAHEHGAKLAEKYEDIKRVIVYPYKSGFTKSQPADFGDIEEFDNVIVPVGNITGAGFYNVRKFALSVPNKKLWQCNMVNEFKQLMPLNVRFKSIYRTMLTCLTLILTCLATLILLPYLFIILFMRTRKN